ncbi:MAG: ATP synthase F0 subunit B [bacterium]
MTSFLKAGFRPIARFFIACSTALLAALWIVAGTPALAAEASGGDPMMDFLFKVINFVVLMAILVYLARKPLANLLRGSSEGARSELETAREAARAAEAKLAEQKSRIENLEADLARLREEAREEARAESAHVIEEARAQAERIKAQIQLQVEQEFNKARAELKRQLADQTIHLAEANIEAQMDAPRREALAGVAIQQMGERR